MWVLRNEMKTRSHVEKLYFCQFGKLSMILIIKDKSIHEIRSVLEFPIEAEDHQSVYKCRAFAEETMSTPKESALKATFNVTCKFFLFFICLNFTHDLVCVNKNSKKLFLFEQTAIGSSICFSNKQSKHLTQFRFSLNFTLHYSLHYSGILEFVAKIWEKEFIYI